MATLQLAKVDFIIVESVVDKRDLDKELPRIKEFITSKTKIWRNLIFLSFQKK